jgi:hypothetical protein
MKYIVAVWDWLRPITYQRANWDTYTRVRVARYLVWAAAGSIIAFFGWMLAQGILASMLLAAVLGVRTISAADLIARYASLICTITPCSDMTALAAQISVGILAVAMGFTLYIFLPNMRITPRPVDEHELEELRMMGYIVMKVEDYERAINGHAADHPAGAGAAGGTAQPGQLDSPGALGSGRIPTPEIFEIPF